VLFALTLATDIATAHGPNLMDLIATQPDGLTEAYLRHLQTDAGGRVEQASFVQTSFERYQEVWTRWEQQVDAPFQLSAQGAWKSLHGRTSERCSGRLIGGCLDTLVHLVGTPFGRLPEFIARHRDTGVVLFLENCELTPVSVARSLWQMRHAGWFDGLHGLVFGRSSGADASDAADLDQREAIESVVGALGMPVVLDADIGHKPPQLLLVNGALAEVTLDGARGKVVQRLS
jgi:muramoyltetrapeptide carboxypeptidase LdcA involved in peptidoglycan recycling